MVILYIGDRGISMPVVRQNPLIASMINHIETRLKKIYAVLLEIMFLLLLHVMQKSEKYFFNYIKI